MYDSRPDIHAHIGRVQNLLDEATLNLEDRAFRHDASKLVSPEVEGFDKYTPKLKGLTYGSDAYKQCLDELGKVLEHHYANNSHHPEHYAFYDGALYKSDLESGDAVARMSLFDIMEMLVDWKAASERHADGDIWKSIDINVKRFGISEQLASILRATAREMGW